MYLLVMGFAAGAVTERIRFDRQRAAVLSRYDEAIRQWHRVRLAAEQGPDAGPTPARLAQATH